MPQLKQLHCCIQWAETGAPFKEYGTVYGDGVVESYIVVPNKPQNFAIRLTSRGFIFEGLSMVVFIDGNYQVNRNRVNLKPGSCNRTDDVNHSEIDFLLRQKEKSQGNNVYIGRQWRFDNHNIVTEPQAGTQERHFEDLGTIEILVLRCRAQSRKDAEDNGSSSGEDSKILEERSEDVFPRDPNDKDIKTGGVDASNDTVAQVPADNSDIFPFAGLFDGAGDFDNSNGRMPVDGRTESGRWIWHQQQSPLSYPQQSSRMRTYEPGNSLQIPQSSTAKPYQSHQYPNASQAKSSKHVHWDYGPYRSSPAPPKAFSQHLPHRPASSERWRYNHGEASNEIPETKGAPPYTPHAAQYKSSSYSDPRSPEVPQAAFCRNQQEYHDNVPQQTQQFANPPNPHPHPAENHSNGLNTAFQDPTDFYRTGPSPYHYYPPMLSMPLASGPHPCFQTGAGIHAYNANGPPYLRGNTWNTSYHPHKVHVGAFDPVNPFIPPVTAPWLNGQAPPGFVQPSTFRGATADQLRNDGNFEDRTAFPGSFAHESFVSPQPGAEATALNTNGNEGPDSDTNWSNGNQNGDSADNNEASGSGNITTNDPNVDNDWDGDNSGANGNGNGNTQNTPDWNNNENDNTNNANWNNQDSKTSGQDWNTQDISNQNANNGNDWGGPQDSALNLQTASGTSHEKLTNQDFTRDLYGPHGAYYTSNPPHEGHAQPDAEEGPRFDVPEQIASARGSTKQVQPGAGYRYYKRSTVPNYVDTLEEPYARFVFKYRTKDQLKMETGIEIEEEPSSNQEVRDLQDMDKQTLIEMLIRAKSALGGKVPSPTMTSSIVAKDDGSIGPVLVDVPIRPYSRYQIPQARPSFANPTNVPAKSDNNATAPGNSPANNQPSTGWDTTNQGSSGTNSNGAGVDQVNWNSNWDGAKESSKTTGNLQLPQPTSTAPAEAPPLPNNSNWVEELTKNIPKYQPTRPKFQIEAKYMDKNFVPGDPRNWISDPGPGTTDPATEGAGRGVGPW